MEVPFPILADRNAMTITVGKKVFNRPYLWRAPELNFSVKNEIVECVEFWRPKDLHRFYCEKLGPKFNRRFQAANYYLWVHDRFTQRTASMLRLEGRNWRNYSDDLVYKANLARPYVNEAERDGLFNLIPLIIVFGENPHQIMKRVGRGAWRRLATNSLSRNLKIMNAAERFRRMRDTNRDVTQYVRKLLDVPSGVMRGIYLGSDEEFVAARITPKKKIEVFTQTRHLVEDALRMLGRDFNPDWSLARMIAEHHAAAKEHNRGHFSEKHFTEAWAFEADGYLATLLTSPLEVATEGQTQHHCVASYANLAKRGAYTVFRIEGKERATLGLRTDVRFPIVDQIYGACNSLVTGECRDFCHKLAIEYDKARGATARAA